MNSFSQPIPGVTLAVYKQQRPLNIEEDGYVGDLLSGYAVIEATIDPGLPFFGFLRQGNDRYLPQRDWVTLDPNPRLKPWHCQIKEWLAQREIRPGAKIFGLKTVLEVDKSTHGSFVSYPNNMLCLAHFGEDDKAHCVDIWKIALVSQRGKYFLTTQLSHSTECYVDKQGRPTFPRFEAHEQLNDFLVACLPSPEKILNLLRPVSEWAPEQESDQGGIAKNEGVVKNFYPARGIGTIATREGVARVHWRDIPPRPRRSFLIKGERVRFKKIGPPFSGRRESAFTLQAYGITVG